MPPCTTICPKSMKPITESNEVSVATNLVPIVAIGAALILITTALLKILSTVGHAGILSELDPILRLPVRTVMVNVGVVEIIGGTILFYKRNDGLFGSVIPLFFGSSFLLYKSMFLKINPRGICPCLGSLGEALSLNNDQVNTISTTLAATLLGLGFINVILSVRNKEYAVNADRTQLVK